MELFSFKHTSPSALWKPDGLVHLYIYIICCHLTLNSYHMMTNARLPPLHSFPSSHRCLHLTLVYLRISKDRRKNLELTSVRASPEAGVWRVAWRTTPEQSKAHEAAAAELPLLRANTAGFLCLSTLQMKEGWPFRSYRSRTGTFREESVRVWLCIKHFLTPLQFLSGAEPPLGWLCGRGNRAPIPISKIS